MKYYFYYRQTNNNATEEELEFDRNINLLQQKLSETEDLIKSINFKITKRQSKNSDESRHNAQTLEMLKMLTSSSYPFTPFLVKNQITIR